MGRSDVAPSDEKRPPSIRFQLLLWVNLALAGGLALFLIVDYRRELADRMADQRVALQEEAQTMAQAIQRLRHRGADTIQGYIDAVCGRMQESQSPGHHIAVRLGEQVLQARAHNRQSSQMLRAMQRAAVVPSHQANLDGRELVVGCYRSGGLEVFVSEFLTNVRRSVWAAYARRLLAIAALALLGAAVVNAVLLHVVVRPIGRLVRTVQRIGSGELGVQARRLRSAECAYLGRAINELSRSLAEADGQRRREMARAGRIQQNLLPKRLAVPGLQVASLFEPAEEVAGDYYDLLPLADGSWLLAIADVTGHGVPAAMGATMLKTFLMHAIEHYTEPPEILAFVNDRFTAISLPEDFASVLLVRWHPHESALDWTSAGHEPALLFSGGRVQELPATGLLVGIDTGSRYRSERVPVSAADRLLLTTDGLTEAPNKKGEQFGKERLKRVFAECAALPLEQAVQRVGRTVAEHRAGRPATDDMTLVAVEFR